MKLRRALDWASIVWLAVWGYFSSVGASLVDKSNVTFFWITSPILLIPAIVWLGWSVYQQENPGPARVTMQTAAFGMGILMLIMQFPPIAQALTQLF